LNAIFKQLHRTSNTLHDHCGWLISIDDHSLAIQEADVPILLEHVGNESKRVARHEVDVRQARRKRVEQCNAELHSPTRNEKLPVQCCRVPGRRNDEAVSQENACLAHLL
jgi:hypothetical protein